MGVCLGTLAIVTVAGLVLLVLGLCRVASDADAASERIAAAMAARERRNG